MSRSFKEPQPLPEHSFRTSKRTVYSGSDSYRFIDPDVIENPPPTQNPSNLMKQKEIIFHEVLDIDNDDATMDLMLVGEKVGISNKGKTIESIHDGYGDHQDMEVWDDIFGPPVMDKSGSSSRVESSNGDTSVSHNLTNDDDHASDQSYDDDDYSDLFSDDFMDVDNYALLQEHFDNANIPPGIEAPIPWMAGYDLGSKKSESNSLYPWCNTQFDGKNSEVTVSSQPSWSLEPTNSEIQGPTAEAMKLPHGGGPPYWGFESTQKAAGSSSSYHSNFIAPVDGQLHFPGIESANSWWWNNTFQFNPFPSSSVFNPFVPAHAPPEQVFPKTWAQTLRDGNNGTADSTIVTISDEARDEILRKFHDFKQFDTAEDTSDHYFVHANSSMKQHSKTWAKRIQVEWKLLEKDLPDSIFVRVYESRLDLLKVVIIGAEGTPYHDGLFFFDVFFPSGYPNVPPEVYYHSGGLRLNPNLYNCGKVCLSLLHTWSGTKNEKWLPGVSTILQVLVSIQGLILNAKPYFNEPGFAGLSGSAEGETRSLQYNEDIFILSLKTMVYIIRKPPKNFEDFVAGHFCSRAHDILVACKAYMDGAQVGCLVKGVVQDVDQGDKSCSRHFKNSLAACVDMLVREVAQVGARDCEKFLSPSTARNKPLGELPVAATFS